MYLQTHFDFFLENPASREPRKNHRLARVLFELLMKLPPHLTPKDMSAFVAESEKFIMTHNKSMLRHWGIVNI